VLPHWIAPELRQRAADRGYANRFEAIRASIPWRPLLLDDSGARLSPRPRIAGPISATVVGPDGSTRPHGDQEVHTDRCGRVRIRYAFQDADDRGAPASTWVRVQQPLAGDGTGAWWIPRIGHEVLVAFFDDDIDRPIVICSLYNGRGEGGEARTPGGADTAQVDTGVFAQSGDACPGGQGNLTGGNSPAWHGGSPAELDQGGQRNAAALSGYKTKEFGGDGYNQLVFDDSPAQLRVQLATTQHATQLNLGHLIHQADNHRGGFRGLGFELRTDAYGAIRGAQGVLLSTYGTSASDPAGDNAAGIALAKQWNTLAKAFSDAAKTHQAVQLSGVIGTRGAHQGALDEKASPIPAWLTQVSGMVSSQAIDQALDDASNKSTTPADGAVPHGTDAVVNVSARAGLAIVAGQDIAFVSAENVQLGSGQDMDVAAGGAMRVHTGQAIGLLGGAIQPGTEAVGTGVTMIAGSGDLDFQSQAATMQLAALKDVILQSQSAGIDWAAARKITLSTAGGASIVIEGGNVTFECPGTITVHAGSKHFVGAASQDVAMPALPLAPMPPDVPCAFNLTLKDVPGPHGSPISQAEWSIVRAKSAGNALVSQDVLLQGITGDQGELTLSDADAKTLREAYDDAPGLIWIVSEGHVHGLELSVNRGDWTERQATVQALDAMGYSDTPQYAENRTIDEFHLPLARQETGLNEAPAMLKKIGAA
jgi:uncharacterized protein (DUF2345 family)